MKKKSLDRRIESLAVLVDPVRRALYSAVASRDGSTSREEAAKAVKISRALAAFHLDKLVEEGYLDAEFRRVSGRSGPGAGRPAKLYKRSSKVVEVSVPSRNYELVARLMASAISEGKREDETAFSFGVDIGEEARGRAGPKAATEKLIRSLESVLDEKGFQPFNAAAGEIRLRNCPFDALANDYRDLVCGMNLSMMKGIVEGLRAKHIEAVFDPKPGMCCVVFRRAARR
ncbi:MAG: helix-turn-helix transcriptional regulator [Actinomycetota bacterium]|nr:transcriptional regulator [Actinomycetota bacterium]